MNRPPAKSMRGVLLDTFDKRDDIHSLLAGGILMAFAGALAWWIWLKVSDDHWALKLLICPFLLGPLAAPYLLGIGCYCLAKQPDFHWRGKSLLGFSGSALFILTVLATGIIAAAALFIFVAAAFYVFITLLPVIIIIAIAVALFRL